nr:MAG: hypothetical protein J07AB56_00540 [Candidatus Nanosalinarum sp. J07AB56]
MAQGERENLLDISNGEVVDATADAAEEMKSAVEERTGGYGEEQQDEVDEEKIKQQLEKLGYR